VRKFIDGDKEVAPRGILVHWLTVLSCFYGQTDGPCGTTEASQRC
jgi:hypothetical protein